jgi:hypothetical protein
MSATARLGLSYLEPQQSQKHVTVNEALRRLDAIVQLSVVSATTGAEPGAPADGAAYILPAGKTGAAWGAMSNLAVAYHVDGAWLQLTPREGWRAFIEDTNQLVVHDGAAWKSVSALGADALFGKLTIEKAGALLENRSSVDGSYQVFGFDNFSATDWHGLFMQARRARGSKATPAAAVSGDGVFAFDMWAHDGSAYVRGGQINFIVEGAVSAGVTPMSIIFRTMDTAGVYNQRIKVTPAGNVAIGSGSPVTKLDVDGPVRVKSYAKASLPSAAAGAGQMIYVSDEAGGAVIAFSDGANWRRVTDRAVVS